MDFYTYFLHNYYLSKWVEAHALWYRQLRQNKLIESPATHNLRFDMTARLNHFLKFIGGHSSDGYATDGKLGRGGKERKTQIAGTLAPLQEAH